MAPNRWIPVIIVAVIVAAVGGGGGAYVYLHNKPSGNSGPVTAQMGSNATVNYIGIFGSGPEQGKIFDTSIYSVATNNAVYPKGLEYHPRGPVANYTPLAVYLGASTPSGGYSLGNLSFIQVVTGFWQGIVGMEPNTTRTVVVPPDLGYGPTDPSCLVTEPLTQTLPVLQILPGVLFQKQFPGVTATDGIEFTDPHFGWTDQILAANSSYVTIQRLPYVGEVASPAGWPEVVTSVTNTANGSGTITVANELTAADAGHLLGKDYLGTGPCGSTTNGPFIVSAVDQGAGTFTEDFNQEVVGQTLIFIITLVDYFPQGTAA